MNSGAGHAVTVRVPREMLGHDDGFLDAARIAGRLASPSDIVPEHGHLELNPPAPPPGAASLERD